MSKSKIITLVFVAALVMLAIVFARSCHSGDALPDDSELNETTAAFPGVSFDDLS